MYLFALSHLQVNWSVSAAPISQAEQPVFSADVQVLQLLWQGLQVFGADLKNFSRQTQDPAFSAEFAWHPRQEFGPAALQVVQEGSQAWQLKEASI